MALRVVVVVALITSCMRCSKNMAMAGMRRCRRLRHVHG